MKKLKKQAELMENISLMATTDNKVIMKVELTEQQKQMLQAAQAPAVVAPVAPSPYQQPTMSPEMARRYGLNPGGRPGQPAASAPAAAAKPDPNALTQPFFPGQGTWKHEGDGYQISVQDEKGKQLAGAAVAEPDKLTVHFPSMTLVMDRVE
jgi:hypothetical protein